MNQPLENNDLRILLLEDMPSDAALEEDALRDAGMIFTMLRVDTREAFVQTLDEFKPDIILADYSLPAYNGRDALEYARLTHPQIPVIMVSGSLGDEAAVELLKLGAKDYVLKDHLMRLAPAIKRALSEEVDIRNRKLAESKYRALFAEAMDGIVLIDCETWQIVDCNPEFERQTGRTLEQLKKLKMWEVLPADQHELARQNLLETRKTGSMGVANLKLQKPGGEITPIESSGKYLSFQQQNFIQGVTRDISERLRAEQALRDSEARYKRITEGLTDYQYTVRVENGRVVETTQSPACVTVTGYKPEEFAANSNLWIQMVVSEDRELVFERVRHVLAGNDVPPIEHRIVRKDGELRWVSDTIIVFKGVSGKLLSYDGVIRDITERKRIEQAIQEEKAFSDSLIHSLPDIFYLIDQQGSLLRWSRKGAELLGLSEEEMPGANVLAFMHEEDRPLITQKIKEAFETGSAETEARMLMKDGIRNYILTATRIETQQGVNVIGVGVDITERKRAEEQIRISQITYEGIINSITETIYIQDENGVFLNVSLSAEKMYGYPREYFVGRTPEFISAPGKNNLAEIAKCVRQAFNGQRQSFEFWGLRKDGTVFPKEISLVPGTYFGEKVVIAVARDITERKEADERLKHSEARHRLILQTSMDGFWIADINGHILEVNDAYCQLLGYTREEILNMSIQDFEAKETPEETAQHIQEIIAKGKVRFETCQRCKDGQLLDIEATVIYQTDNEGGNFFAFMRDITQRKRAEDALLRANRALKTLSAGNLALVRATNEDELLGLVTSVIVETGGYLMAWVGYAEDDAAKTVRPVAQCGDEEGYLETVNLTWADTKRGQGPTGTAIRERVTVLNQDYLTNNKMAPWREAAIKRGYQSSIAIPLVRIKRVLGALTIYSSDPFAFSKDEVALLEELANDLAFGIETLRTRLVHEQHATILRQSLEQSIQTIAGTLEARDPYTAGHQRRVGELATAIAREMGLPFEQVNGIHLAAIIHDLGKIHIPAEILSKPSRLTDIEFMLIKTHPQAGYDILKDVKFPWPIADIVLQHHERLDGSGYPQGLKDGQILLESKIMTVADVVEAMSSHRPYRPALGIEAALSEIERGRGSLYDPAAVDACLRLFAKKGFAFSSKST